MTARHAATTDDLTPGMARRIWDGIQAVIRADQAHHRGYRHIPTSWEPVAHQTLLNAVLDGHIITYPDGTDSTPDILASAPDIARAYDRMLATPKHRQD